ncbi:MAG: response regulator [Pirellulales bacterium]
MHIKKRLLIVEDQPEAAGVLAMMAQQFDCQTLVADCGMSALDIASWWNPDVVTIDLGLPDIDGLKVAAALRPKLPAAKLVAVSGKQPDQSMLAAAGFDCYLQKPICLDRLKEALADC